MMHSNDTNEAGPDSYPSHGDEGQSSDDRSSLLRDTTSGGDHCSGYRTSQRSVECEDLCPQDGDKTESGSHFCDQPETLSLRDTRLWATARYLGYASFLLLLALGIFCFVEAKQSESSSVFAFAFSCLLDSSGAAIVIWRSFSTDSLQKSKIRELQAQVIIGCLFWVAAMFILVRAMLYLSEVSDQDEQESRLLYILLGIGGGLQLFFFLTKTPIAIILKSKALVADGVNSLAACVLASAGISASVIGQSSERLAITDDLVGVVVSFLIAGYGSYLLYQVWTDTLAPEVIGIPDTSVSCGSNAKKDAERQVYDNTRTEKSPLLPPRDKTVTV